MNLLNTTPNANICFHSGGRLEKIAKDHFSGPYIWDHYDVECCTSGSFVLEIDGTSHLLLPGDLYVIPPRTVYTKRYRTESKASYLCVSGNALGSIFDSIGLSMPNVVFSKRLTEQAVEYLEKTIASLESRESVFVKDTVESRYVNIIPNEHFSDHQNIEAFLRSSAWFFLFLSELMGIYNTNRMNKNTPKTTQQKYVENVIHYINANYYLELNVNQIAEYIGIDRSYLFTLFKKETGMSIRDYILHVRMKIARDLLIHSDTPINTIATSVGYESCSFSRIFKKKNGLTPAQYRLHYTDSEI